MAHLLNLHGINYSDGTDDLLINYFGAFRSYNSTTGVWDDESQSMTSGYLIDSANFLDHAFFVNGNDSNLSRNSSGTWSTSTNLTNAPVAKYVMPYKVKLYLANIKINSTWYRSRVWYSDLPKNGQITWGLEYGTDLSMTSGSAVVTSASASFQSNNINVGDPFIIENGTNAGEYIVRTVDSETQITLTETLSNTDSSKTYWVGDNWFDVNTDDGDVLTGLGRNSNELLPFKRNSFHRFNVLANSLRQVKEVPGTSSFRSIVNHNEFTYYYDPASEAIRRYDGSRAIIISAAIEDIVSNISDPAAVVGWVTKGRWIEFYIGDITTRDGESITNCVITFNTLDESWTCRSLPWVVDYSTKWTQNNKPESYIGTQSNRVLKTNSGYKYDATDIGFQLIDSPVFPEGEDAVVDFQRLRLMVENGHGIQIMYKLIYQPYDDKRWTSSEWFPLKGKSDADKVEFIFPDTQPKRGGGIQLKFIQSSGTESFLIEEYVLYYSNEAIR